MRVAPCSRRSRLGKEDRNDSPERRSLSVAGRASHRSCRRTGPQRRRRQRTAHFPCACWRVGLEGPWEMSWGPDGRLWVTERTGKRVTRINPADGTKTVAVTIPDVHQSASQDGLLGMALHPELLRGTGADYVYVFLTYAVNPPPEVHRRGMIRRYTYHPETQTLTSPVDLLTGLPAHNDHVSGRLAFGPDRKLYLSVGDQGSNFGGNYCIPNRAQQVPSASEVADRDWMKYQGKLLRVNLDGTIPADNPVIAGVRSHIYSYGHRNIQGITFGLDGRVYAAEHGPSTDDEVNLIQAGKNYGWPNVAGYNDDRAYVYGNWSAASSCSTLTFSPVAVPPEVPQQKESAWHHPDFMPPLKTFFTVDNGYDFRARGGATIAPCWTEAVRWRCERHPGLDEFAAPGGFEGRASVSPEIERRRHRDSRRPRGALQDDESLSGHRVCSGRPHDLPRHRSRGPVDRFNRCVYDTAGKWRLDSRVHLPGPPVTSCGHDVPFERQDVLSE